MSDESLTVEGDCESVAVVNEITMACLLEEVTEVACVERDNAEILVVTEGTPGPPGAAGSGVNFSQPTPASVWTIAHNLGFRPDVATYRLGGTEIKGAVHHLDLTSLTVTFNIPVAGYARIS